MEDSVRRILRERFHLVNIKPEWLKKVVESPKVSRGGDIAASVSELLLSSNLRDVSTGSFPPRIAQKQNETIRGPHLAQIEELVNVAVPIENRYSTSDDSKMRMFKLCLHDGNQQFFAIEWKRIAQLSTTMTAGQKILLSNVQVRRGLMLLSQENVKFLGGCVDQLQAAAVAQRQKTVKSLVPEEWMTELGEMPADQKEADAGNFDDAMDIDMNPIPPQIVAPPAPIAPRVAAAVAPQPVRQVAPLGLPPSRPSKTDPPSYFEDDDGMDEVFATMELPSARPPKQPPTIPSSFPPRTSSVPAATSSYSSVVKSEAANVTVPPSSSSRPLPATSSSTASSMLSATKRRKIDEDPEVLDLTNVSSEALATASPDELDKLLVPRLKPNTVPNTAPSKNVVAEPTRSPVLEQRHLSANDAPSAGNDAMDIDDDGIEFQVEEEEPEAIQRHSPIRYDLVDEFPDTDALEALDAAEKTYSTSPFHYLCDILKTTHSRETPYKISAFVLSAVSQLDMSGGEYRLDVDIEDGTGKCRASLHDHIMESLIGMPANDFIPFYSAQDEGTRTIASGMVSQCQDALRAFCGTMEITFFPDGRSPVITRLEFGRKEVIQDTRRLIRAVR